MKGIIAPRLPSSAFVTGLLMLVAPWPLSGQTIQGLVWNGATGVPLPAATISVTFLSQEPATSTTTDAGGQFAVVLPAPGSYLVVATLAGYAQDDTAAVSVREGQQADVLIELTPIDPTGVEVRTREAAGETSIVYGQVLEGGSSRPVADVEVTLGDGRGTTVTRWDGRFFFPDVAPGVVSIEIEHLAYASLNDEIEVEPRQAYEVVARVREEAIELEPLEVTVRSRPAARLHRDVLFRMDRNLGGSFLTARDFERQGTPPLVYTLDGLPSTHVERRCSSRDCVPEDREITANGYVEFDPFADWTWLVTLRGGCIPSIYIDGILVSRPGEEQTMFLGMSTTEVEIMEVYPSPASLPPEYNDPGTVCAIGIWTKRGG